jgi:UDP-N-acetylglucosamine:LPS N-acetylglucosamine transferase
MNGGYFLGNPGTFPRENENIERIRSDSDFMTGLTVASSVSRYLQLFYFEAGGGHRSAAMAVQQVISKRFSHWRVELVNLQDLLQRGWTYGSLAMLRGLQKGIKFYTPQIEELLRQHWQHGQPDLVVSLIPNFNGVMFRALRHIHSDVPYVTIMTDLADYPPHFWLEKQEQFIICGSNRAVRQARAIGHPPRRIFQVSGMILKPDFYVYDPTDRRMERERLGLDPDLPTALIMFGGNGAKVSIKIVKRLKRAKMKLQCLVMCGHNEKLLRKLKDRQGCQAVGFTNKVAYYMRLSDFFIGKPGPGSISEALHCGLPVIVERNRRTMPQERYNTKWLEKHKVGIVTKDFDDIAKAVRSLLGDGCLRQFQRNAQRLDNYAVFQIPSIFEQIITASAEEAKPFAGTPARA